MEEVIIPPATAGTTGFIASGGSNRQHQDPDRVRPADFYASQVAQAADISAVAIAVEKTGAANELATNVAAGALGVSIATTAAAGQLATNVASQQTQNLAIQQFNSSSVQAQTFAAAASVQAQTNAAATALAIQVAAGAAQLYAAQNHAAALAQAAECCCEIKTLVIADGAKTRDLISTIQASNLAVQLVDAKNEILALKIKSSSISI